MKAFLLSINIAIIVCGGFWVSTANVVDDLPKSIIICIAIGWALSSLTNELDKKEL